MKPCWKSFATWIGLACAIMVSAWGTASTRADDANAVELTSLRASLDRAIELLEAEDYAAYIEEFYSVEEYNFLSGSRRLTDEARHLAALPRFKERMLTALRIARDSEPHWSEEGTVAQFNVDLTAAADPDEPVEPMAEPSIPDVPGWGEDLDEVLSSALKALNEEDYHTFVERVFPAGEVVQMQSSNGMDLLLLKLETYPEMIETMRRDLEQCQSEGARIDGDVAEFKLTEGRQNPQIVRFQLVAGNWRLYDSISAVREEAEFIAAQSGSGEGDVVMLEFEQVGDAWRLPYDAPEEDEYYDPYYDEYYIDEGAYYDEEMALPAPAIEYDEPEFDDSEFDDLEATSPAVEEDE